MRPPQQITLAVDSPLVPSFDNFIVGANSELVSGLQRSIDSREFVAIWLCGANSVGKTHLLRASYLKAKNNGQDVLFVGCAQSPGVSQTTPVLKELKRASDFGATVCIDGVDSLAGVPELEYLLMATYQRLLEEQGVLLLSHTAAATTIQFELADLNSRLRSMLHYQLQPLSDDEKAQLLRLRALHKGYELDDAVLAYWLSRGPRDITALLTDLDRLDRASLSQRRQVTVPLLKDELGY
jgi:DnaA family protein